MNHKATDHNSCEDCVNCTILEDRSEDMRRPYASCIKNHDITTIDVMEFKPTNNICNDYKAGEPTWI